MTDNPAPKFLWTLFQQLRHRRFSLGPDDYEALRQALRAGFGWSSSEALCDLCCILWAKSKNEKSIIQALFEQSDISDWYLSEAESFPTDTDLSTAKKESEDYPQISSKPQVLATEARGGLPSISINELKLPNYRFIFVPQLPLTYREVAQAWRRLRRPVRDGPPTELDVEATIARRVRLGIVSEVVLVPRRRNISRVLLLIDRQGSMTPFHYFVDEVCAAIKAVNLENVALYYFHDTPIEGTDETLLHACGDELFPTLDSILPKIAPFSEGFLYEDPDLLVSQGLSEILDRHANSAAVIFISDAGAARGHYDTVRLLDTIAFLKTLRTHTVQYIWLNPLPPKYWSNNTAAQIARYIPMFPLDREGMYRAVNTLRGQLYLIEKPI